MSTSRADLMAHLERVVDEACASETNAYGYGIWSHHIREVVRHSKQLARHFGADPQVVEIAALLHDYTAIKDQGLYEEHHVHSAMEAQRTLERFGYPQDKIESVKHCILAHRASAPQEKQSPEAECLANADALAHLEQVPSLLFLAFVHHRMDIDEGTLWVREKLQRSWNKLSPSVQETMTARYAAAMKTLDVHSMNESSLPRTSK